jgi:hypothetical protein
LPFSIIIVSPVEAFFEAVTAAFASIFGLIIGDSVIKSNLSISFNRRLERVDGIDGVNWVDGIDRVNWVDGIDGVNWVDGIDRVNWVDGIDGVNWVDGIDGVNWVNGIDRVDGIGRSRSSQNWHVLGLKTIIVLDGDITLITPDDN